MTPKLAMSTGRKVSLDSPWNKVVDGLTPVEGMRI